MRSSLQILTLIVGLLTTTFLYGQRFSATVNRNTVGVGEHFKLTYSLNDRAERFMPPNFRNFRVLSGPNQSTSMSYTNGQMSSSSSFSYILAAVREGKFDIPAAKVSANGKELTSNEIPITVTAAAAKPQQNKPQGGGNVNQPNTGDQVKDNVFIKLLVSKSKAYQGEQIIATFKIYTRLNIVDNAIDQMPSFTGFYSEDINSKDQGSLKPEVINGVQFNTAIIKQVVLSPQRNGKIEIEPLSMDLVIRVRDDRRPRSVFDQFFGSYKDIRYKAVSNKATINVSALPTQGKPGNFSGAVGQFKLTAEIDKQEVKENEAINLKLRYSGNGNIKLIGDPEINFPPDFEVYDPKKNVNVNTSLAGVKGNKDFEYLIIPRHAGQFTIPSVDFTYFDPAQKKYVTQKTEEFQINVLRGDGSSAAVANGGSVRSVSKKDVTMLGRDIRFIKQGKARLKEANSFFMGSRLFYLLLALPVIILFFLFLARKRLREMQADKVGMRKRKATKVASKRLALAKKHMDSGEKNEFYEEVFRSLYGYVSDKFNIALADLNKDLIKDTLAAQNVSNTVSDQLLDVLGECEMARFAPSAALSEPEVFKASEDIINKIEEEIK